MFQNVPKCSKRFQKVPKGSKRFQKVPGHLGHVETTWNPENPSQEAHRGRVAARKRRINNGCQFFLLFLFVFFDEHSLLRTSPLPSSTTKKDKEKSMLCCCENTVNKGQAKAKCQLRASLGKANISSHSTRHYAVDGNDHRDATTLGSAPPGRLGLHPSCGVPGHASTRPDACPSRPSVCRTHPPRPWWEETWPHSDC